MVVAGLGIEPRLEASKAPVLPLDDPADANSYTLTKAFSLLEPNVHWLVCHLDYIRTRFFRITKRHTQHVFDRRRMPTELQSHRRSI